MNNEIPFPTNFNMMQSVESVKSQVKEIQRSLEKRLARIIGDLEGTFARDGILQCKALMPSPKLLPFNIDRFGTNTTI